MKKGTLYMLPVPISDDGSWQQSLPSYNREVILQIKVFVVENIRSARRFLKRIDREIDIDELTFYELSRKEHELEIDRYLKHLEKGEDVGMLSEAGCPGIADPGSQLARGAQALGIRVVPLVGPSSIFLALMASGMQGQSFTFHGYLPIEKDARSQKIAQMAREVEGRGTTQIFIETPYRNDALLKELLTSCRPETRLCIARGILSAEEWIETRKVQAWRKEQPVIGKVPTIFILGR